MPARLAAARWPPHARLPDGPLAGDSLRPLREAGVPTVHRRLYLGHPGGHVGRVEQQLGDHGQIPPRRCVGSQGRESRGHVGEPPVDQRDGPQHLAGQVPEASWPAGRCWCGRGPDGPIAPRKASRTVWRAKSCDAPLAPAHAPVQRFWAPGSPPAATSGPRTSRRAGPPRRPPASPSEPASRLPRHPIGPPRRRAHDRLPVSQPAGKKRPPLRPPNAWGRRGGAASARGGRRLRRTGPTPHSGGCRQLVPLGRGRSSSPRRLPGAAGSTAATSPPCARRAAPGAPPAQPRRWRAGDTQAIPHDTFQQVSTARYRSVPERPR